MGACAAPELNLTATERHESTLRELGGVRERLLRATWMAQEENRSLRRDLERDQAATDETRAAAAAKAGELAEELRVLKAMEEDIVAVRRRRDAVAAETTRLREAEATVATLETRLVELSAQAKTLEEAVAAREQALAARTAAATARSATIGPLLEAFVTASKALDAAIAAAAAAAVPPPDSAATGK